MELLVYKASAGAGKTFTLAVEYIKHLILNPLAYRQILAVTFTNKATAEMKERILQQLYGIWKGDPASDVYLACIRQRLQEAAGNDRHGMTDEELRQRAGQALTYMLHDYNNFRVETIDSFFQSVMRNLARELELAPNLNIELNNSEVLNDAVDSLIEKLSPTSQVLAWLLDYINERIANDKRWNVSDEVKSFGHYIFDESYIERGRELREKLRSHDTLKLYKAVLREIEGEARKSMKRYHDLFMEELTNHDLTPADLKGGDRSIGSYFRKLRDGKLSQKEAYNKTVEACLTDAKNWATKTSARKNEIIALAEKSLLPLLRAAEQERPQRNSDINSCTLSLQHLNKLQLLNHIDEEVRLQNREHNRFLLSDTNALLHGLVSEGDSSFVFEKIGANIRNVMIDEFQDTSRMQWDNFRLLLLEGLSQGADSLIVGDVKQSIYRWRNGDWGILEGLTAQQPANGTDSTKRTPFPYPIRVETLKTNRRSEANIIGFNNRFFTQAVDYLNGLHLSELMEECFPLKNAYADVVQESPKSEQRGYVKAAILQPDKEHSYAEMTLNALGNEVLRLRQAGVELNDMAILVRKNKVIPAIADYFDKELHIPIVSNEAFRLDASQAVCMLIDALRCLAEPEEKIARASLLMNLKQMGGEPADETTAWNELEDALPAAFTERREELRLMPLHELLEELYTLLGLQRIEKQEAYLFSFMDTVTEYLQNNPSDLNLFIRHWDEKLCSKTIPGGEMEGIRIFSIHKSKGLEFHTVLIPFCDWKLEDETRRQMVWCVPPTAPYNALNLVPVTYSPLMAESIYRKEYLHERLQLWVDNLNLLYVAFTRAGKNLILWSSKKEKNSVSDLFADILPRIATENGDYWDEEEGLFESGTLCPSKKAAARQPEEQGEPAFRNRLTQKAGRRPVQMESRRPDITFRQSNRSADFIAGRDEGDSWQRFINRGCLLHTLFSSIRTRDDAEQAIDRLVFEGVITDSGEEEEVRQLTRRAFTHPLVQQWYDGSWRLFNECDIIWMENGQLHNRRPDRVMMKEGQIVVLDFKFGKPNRRYNKQVKDYIDLLSSMGYPKEEIHGYLWYVDEDNVEQVES
ncbi:MAG: UvrD-helicase domain-containing protein [Bacteroides sp.]|nr:UvrD-helicase domain-containing protein [Bacteroides sp.]